MWTLTDFHLCRPPWESPQSETLDWLSHAYLEAKHQRFGTAPSRESVEKMDRLVRRYGCSPRLIGQRGHEVRDFRHRDWSEMEVYRLSENPHGAILSRRMEIFSRGALRAFGELYPNRNHPPPREMIHVTCTGYASPSPVQLFCESRGWVRNTRIAQLYHSGCYAAIPAVRQAMGSAIWMKHAGKSSPSVDVVHTEMCSLHLDPLGFKPEQLVVHSLFADGHVRYSLGAWDGVTAGLAVRALHEEILPNTTKEMQWHLDPYAFQMVLSRAVPELLGSVVKEFADRLFERAGIEKQDGFVWAVHPGGPRILDVIQDKLRLVDTQIATSRRILFEFGNMSSATLPHIWADLIKDPLVPRGTLIPSLAFGPGLTLAGALLEKV